MSIRAASPRDPLPEPRRGRAATTTIRFLAFLIPLVVCRPLPADSPARSLGSGPLPEAAPSVPPPEAAAARSVTPSAPAASGQIPQAGGARACRDNSLGQDCHWKAADITQVETDPTYGHSPDNAIKVGGPIGGPSAQRAYLGTLRGPRGEPISYERTHSCCAFNPPGSPFRGMLDVYRVTYPGQAAPIDLYLNMYECAPLRIPVGFTPAPKSGKAGAK